MVQTLESCIHCDREPRYGMKLPKVIDCCYKHKTDDMITLAKMLTFCVEVNCPTRATYNYNGLKPAYCYVDSDHGMVNVEKRGSNPIVVEPVTVVNDKGDQSTSDMMAELSSFLNELRKRYPDSEILVYVTINNIVM